MARVNYTPEQSVMKMREIDVLIAQGKGTMEACKQAQVSKDTYYRWRKEFGGMQIDQVKKLENEVWVLRGMQVRAAYQFLGIGTRLIKALEADIPSKDCFCLPYKWLEKFYGQIGFRTISSELAPEFLLKRLAEYQSPDLILMKRVVPS